MTTYKMSIGPVPYDEPCAQIGVTPNFNDVARSECRAYRAALIAHYGPPPEGAELRIMACAHDFGTYYDLCVSYDCDVAGAAEYAEAVENGLARWEDADFPAPFTYGERSNIVERHFEDTTHLVASVIATLDAAGPTRTVARERLAEIWPEAVEIVEKSRHQDN